MKEAPQIPQQKIPVTIITGFLGSGKTTFLNHLLRKYENTRFAIIENEFGELGVDKDILLHDKIPVYELVNGCICCTLNGDFYKSLQVILDNHAGIDHLLVETTGIADPGKVIDLFMSNDYVQKHFILNSVICLADSTCLEKTLSLEPEAFKQVALSDIVMLNKVDLLKNKKTTSLKELVAGINPMAQIIETTHAHTNGTPVLATKAYSCPHIERSTLSFDNLTISLKDVIAKNQYNGWAPGLYKHEIHAEGFLYNECFNTELFNIWISSFIYFNQHNLYRVKGILYSKTNNKRYIFQAVKGSCVFEEGSEWQEGEERFSKIVFIGKSIDRAELEDKLSRLFVNYSKQSMLGV